MDSWKAWAVMFLSVCVMVVVLANLDYPEAAIVAVVIPFGLGIVCAFLGYFRRGREIRHQERLAMIEKGIYFEARKHDSGIPSMVVVLLVGIGLATVIASDVAFFGFALLFVGIGLIIRSRLMHNRNKEQAGLPAASAVSAAGGDTSRGDGPGVDAAGGDTPGGDGPGVDAAGGDTPGGDAPSGKGGYRQGETRLSDRAQ